MEYVVCNTDLVFVFGRFSLAPSDHWTFRYKFLWQAPLTAVTLADSQSEKMTCV